MSQDLISRLRRFLRFQNIPLGVVLVVPFVLEVMLAVGLTAYFSHRHGQEAVSRVAYRLMAELSDRVEAQLQDYLELPVQLADDVAQTFEWGLVSWQNETTLERYFKQRLMVTNRSGHPLDALLLIDHQKNLTVVEHLYPAQWLIYKQTATSKRLLHYDPLTRDGGQVGAPAKIRIDSAAAALPKRGWEPVAHPTDTGVWQFTSQLGVDRPSLMLTYLRQFQSRRGFPQGSVGVSIHLEQINHFLEKQHISPQGQAFIVEPTGALIASSGGTFTPRLQREHLLDSTSTSLLETVDPSQRSRLKATRSANTTTRHAAQYLTQTLGGVGHISQKRQLHIQVDEKEYFLQVTPLQTPNNLNWALVVAIPKTDFATQLIHYNHIMWGLSGLALIGSITLGLITAQQITRPILRLSRASQDLMLDKLEQPVEEHSRITELAMMAHSFNKMTEQLLTSFDQVKLALQESKEKFTTVFRTSPDPIIVTTLPDGKILEVNDSFLRLTGYTRKDAIDRTAIELQLWPNLEDRQKLMQVIEETGRVCNQEVSTVNQAGVSLTVLVSSERIEIDGHPCLLTVAKDITERKRLEEALRQSEAKLQDVLNSVAASICYFYVDEHEELQALYFSAAAQDVFGYAPETLLADPTLWQSHVYPEDWQHKVQPCLQQVVTGQSMTLEYRYEHPHTGLRWLSADVTVRWDNAQNRWLVTSVECDITDRKQAEEALRVSEERFRMAFDSATIGMDIAAPDGHLLRVNPAICQMLGYSEAELLHRTYRDVTHPDDLAVDHAANLQILRGEVPSLTFEKRFIHKDGQTIWALLSLGLVRDLQGQPLYWVAQVQNITARKQTEDAMRESEARFRAVFDTATLGIAITTLNGNIVEVNDTFCCISGYFKTELHQMQLQDLIHPDDLHRWFRLVQGLDTQWLDHHPLKLCCIRKDGQFRWVELTILLIRDAERNPLHLVVRMEVLPITTHSGSSDWTELESWYQS